MTGAASQRMYQMEKPLNKRANAEEGPSMHLRQRSTAQPGEGHAHCDPKGKNTLHLYACITLTSTPPVHTLPQLLPGTAARNHCSVYAATAGMQPHARMSVFSSTVERNAQGSSHIRRFHRSCSVYISEGWMPARTGGCWHFPQPTRSN